VWAIPLVTYLLKRNIGLRELWAGQNLVLNLGIIMSPQRLQVSSCDAPFNKKNEFPQSFHTPDEVKRWGSSFRFFGQGHNRSSLVAKAKSASGCRQVVCA
jgi:hypothetical protein